MNGKVEGTILGGDVILKSLAFVVGDILHRSLTIWNGAHFDGRSVKAPAAIGQQLQTHSEENGTRSRREAPNKEAKDP